MFKRYTSLFILLSFIFSFSNEIGSTSFDHSYTLSIKDGMYSVVYVTLSSECEDCHDEGCHDNASHCMHHCSGLHNLLENKQASNLSNGIDISSKVTWYYNFSYDEPYLDQALKPPLFS